MDSKRLAYLEYIFMFDTDSTWNNIYSFERDLSDFFASYGLEANVVKTIEGGSSRRIIQVTKIDPMTKETNFHNPTVRESTPRQVINEKKVGP